MNAKIKLKDNQKCTAAENGIKLREQRGAIMHVSDNKPWKKELAQHRGNNPSKAAAHQMRGGGYRSSPSSSCAIPSGVGFHVPPQISILVARDELC